MLQLEITTDANRIDRDLVHDWIGRSYWAAGIPRRVFDRALDHSMCFGAFLADGRQVGFARVISDRATFAYLCDVFVEPDLRGAGIGRMLMAAIDADPDLQGLRRWMLATRDAHGLYAKSGWCAVPDPSILMQRHDPDIYKSG